MSFKAEALAGVLLLLFAAGVALIGWFLPQDDLAGNGPVQYFYSIQIGVGSFVFDVPDLPPLFSSNRSATNSLMWIAGTTAAVGVSMLAYAWIRSYLQFRMNPQQDNANNQS